MSTINGNTEPDKRSYTPFSEADRIQTLGVTSEGIDKGPVLFDENKVSPEELRQILGEGVDLIPASEKLNKLSSHSDVSKISRFDNLDKISFPEMMLGDTEGVSDDVKDPTHVILPDTYYKNKTHIISSDMHGKDNIPKPVDESQIGEGSQDYIDCDFDG